MILNESKAYGQPFLGSQAGLLISRSLLSLHDGILVSVCVRSMSINLTLQTSYDTLKGS